MFFYMLDNCILKIVVFIGILINWYNKVIFLFIFFFNLCCLFIIRLLDYGKDIVIKIIYVMVLS